MPTAAGLAYEDHGGGDEDPPLVFVHGAGGSRLHWPPSLRRLRGFRCLALDLPGHGQSSGVGASSIEEYVQSLHEWREALGLGRSYLVGHSMGGAIALTAALQASGWIAGLVLVGSGARLPVNVGLLEGTAAPERFDQTVEQILRWSFAPQAAPRLVELTRRRLHATGPAVLHRDFLACSVFDVQARLGDLHLPTLLVCGAQDRMTPLPRTEELARGLEGSTTTIVEGAGHMVMLEKPTDVEATLREFLVRPRT